MDHQYPPSFTLPVSIGIIILHSTDRLIINNTLTSHTVNSGRYNIAFNLLFTAVSQFGFSEQLILFRKDSPYLFTHKNRPRNWPNLVAMSPNLGHFNNKIEELEEDCLGLLINRWAKIGLDELVCCPTDSKNRNERRTQSTPNVEQ